MNTTLSSEQLALIESHLAQPHLSGYHFSIMGRTGHLVYDQDLLYILREQADPALDRQTFCVARGYLATVLTYVLSFLSHHKGVMTDEDMASFTAYLRSRYTTEQAIQDWHAHHPNIALLHHYVTDTERIHTALHIAKQCIMQHFTPTPLATDTVVTLPTVVRITGPDIPRPVVFNTYHPHTLNDHRPSAIMTMMHSYTSPSWTLQHNLCNNPAVTIQAYGLIAMILNHAIRANKNGHFDAKAFFCHDPHPLPKDFTSPQDFLTVVCLNNLDMTLVKIRRDTLFAHYTACYHQLWSHHIDFDANTPEFLIREGYSLDSIILYVEQFLFRLTQQTPLWRQLCPMQQRTLANYFNFYVHYLEDRGADATAIRDYISLNRHEAQPLCDFLHLDRECTPDMLQLLLDQPDSPFLWPDYRDSATDSQKHRFEEKLKQLIAAHKKDMTVQIKQWLHDNEHVILRPRHTKTEYEYLKRFGYPRGQSAYYFA